MKNIILLLFFPFISFSQTSITNDNIHDAVDLWESNQTSAEAEYGHISNWDTSNVTSMTYLFYDFQSFNDDIGGWDVSNVTDMSYLFCFAIDFNQDISNWDVSNVANMQGMFYNALNFDNGFNPDGINSWDVSSVTNMSAMFMNQTYFSSDLSSWNVSNVTTMASMFRDVSSSSFQFLSQWDVSSVTNMSSMFSEAGGSFGDLGNWNVSSVTDMAGMFYESSVFDLSYHGLSNWDVSNVTDMSYMFAETGVFGNIENWDVSNVTLMVGMFYNATFFGADIDPNAGDPVVMDLGLWNISNVTDMSNMFTNQEDTGIFYGLSTTNYDKILIGWAQQDVTQGVHFYSFGVNYCEAENSRQYLIDNFNWVIGDDGYDCSNLSINEENMLEVSLYPNPTSSCIYINSNTELEAVVFDILGKELIRESINGELDVNSLEKGTYLLRLSDGINTSTHKIIKE